MPGNLSANELATLGVLGVVGVVLLIAVVYLGHGLFQARSLVRREFSAYFLSPIAYTVLVVFLAVTGHLFYLTFDLLTTTGPKGTEWPMRTMFADERFWLVFLFIPPLLTMRLFAEERSSGTLEMLMTAPLRDWQVVLSKYLACLAFYCVLWLPTLVYLPALLGLQLHSFGPFDAPGLWTLHSILFVAGLVAALLGVLLLYPSLSGSGRLLSLVLLVGGIAAAVTGGVLHWQDAGPHLAEMTSQIDPYPVFATYLGMFLAGAMFLALGMLVSSLVGNQMVAAITALAVSLPFVVAGFWRPDVATQAAGSEVVRYFSVPLHFDQWFTRGMIDTRPIILYASVALFCLFLTVRSLESRRWR